MTRDSRVYVALQESSILKAGEAYWLIQLSGDTIFLSLPPDAYQPEGAQLQGCLTGETCSQINLPDSQNNKVGWTMMTASSSASVELGDIRVADNLEGQEGCTLPEAEAFSTFHDVLWKYDAGQPGYITVSGDSDVMDPWSGYWGASLVSEANNRKLLVPLVIPPEIG